MRKPSVLYYARMTYRMREDPEGVWLEPVAPPSASVIWLHGLGASGHDFVSIVPELGLAPAPGVRFVFPHAPVRPVTLNQGYRMRAWYDIRALSGASMEDAEGIQASAARIETLIRREADHGIAYARIILAGFSQGGAMALHVGTRFSESLGGVLALSTYLPLRDRLPAEASDANRRIPILMCHGRSDALLTIQVGRFARDLLQRSGYAVDWKEYDMAHEVCAAEIADIGTWLRGRL
jgi:phospholipase/carboxylesterase